VRFEALPGERTLVRLVMGYEPKGVVDNAGDALGVFTRHVEKTMQDFKSYIEHRGGEDGAWRGGVHDSRPTTPGATTDIRRRSQ
jgi:hypothetical protein